jgi:hypothetical protein
MIISVWIVFKIRNFIDKFAEKLKTNILYSVTISEIGTLIRKCVQFCTDRQTIDSNVTDRMVIPYCIIKSTDTNQPMYFLIPFWQE